MRRIATLILVVLILISSAAAESSKPDYILEGYDGDATNRVWETNAFFTRMAEKTGTGIRFQFRQADSYADWKERKEKIAAGENLPDVLFKAELTTQEIRKMYRDGILINLCEYNLEKNAPHLWALLEEKPEWKAAITLENGAIPALPSFNPLQDNDYMWINTRWLNAIRMEMPGTAEELKTVLRKFRDEDPNGNGKADEVPLTFLSMWELRFLAHAFGIIDNDYYVSVQDGKVVSSLTSEENRAFLTWLHELWEEKLLDQKGFNNTDSLRKIRDTEPGKNPYGMIMSSSPLTVVPAELLPSYSILMPLQYNGQQIYRDLTGDVIRGTFAITSACEDPETMLRWVDYLYTEEGALLAEYGLEGEEYSWNERGYWEWNRGKESIATSIFPDKVIDSGNQTTRLILNEYSMSIGNAVPGIVPVDFQTKYDTDGIRQIVTAMNEFRTYCQLSFPYVMLTEEDAAALAKIQSGLMYYAEETMACFVTGDLELNDENWRIFCDTIHDKGLDDAIAIWQKYIKE